MFFDHIDSIDKIEFKPIGIDINGNEVLIEIIDWYLTENKSIYATYKNLKELTIPEDIQRVYCAFNHLTNLQIPPSVEYLSCDKELFHYDTCNVIDVHIHYMQPAPEPEL